MQLAQASTARTSSAYVRGAGGWVWNLRAEALGFVGGSGITKRKTKRERPSGTGYVGRVDDKIYSYDDPNLLAAFAVARAARFEHGQTP